jgi:cyclic pyranopterin phosphate synthase
MHEPKGLSRVHMVDISEKPVTRRVARALAKVAMNPETAKMIQEGKIPKGDVLATSQIAAIMAVKGTANLLPLCHPVPIENVKVDFTFDGSSSLVIAVEVASTSKTGLEMEALTGAAVAALCVYDMCKAVEPGMTIEQIALEYKAGGKSGEFRRA